jgi:hypothetical protein
LRGERLETDGWLEEQLVSQKRKKIIWQASILCSTIETNIKLNITLFKPQPIIQFFAQININK